MQSHQIEVYYVGDRMELNSWEMEMQILRLNIRLVLYRDYQMLQVWQWDLIMGVLQ